MGITYNSSVVRSGLVLYLDAANRKSYPGTGTIWTDLSGIGNNATLTNGPTFNNANNGSIVFDGANDLATVTVPTINTTAGQFNTVEMWMFWTGGRNGFPMEFSSYRLWQPPSPNALGFNNNAGDCYGFNDSSLSNKWIHLVALFYNGAYTNNSKIYVNTVNQTLTKQTGSATSGTASSQITIAGYGTGATSYPFPGRISSFKIYNRGLSDSEIRQNFEATRDRYGV